MPPCRLKGAVIQFKKYFLALVFTVALCCGLSVSAFAVQYSASDVGGSYMSNYDGSIAKYTQFDVGSFPLSFSTVFPSSVTQTSPKQIFTLSLPQVIPAGKTFYFRFMFPDVHSSFDIPGSYTFSFSSSGAVFTPTSFFDVDLVNLTLHPNDSVIELIDPSSFSSGFIFDESGSPVGFNVSGVLLSDFSVFQCSVLLGNTSYPYIVETTFTSYNDIIFSDSPIVSSSVYNPQISASQFSVTSTTFTSQVNLTGLDPTKIYRPYWSLYEVSDLTTVISSGYSNQIGDVTGVEDYTGYSRIVDLKPGTEYLINWNLYEVGSFPVPTASEIRFTTLSDGSSGGGSGSTDDSGGILLMILNKVSAILDTLSGGQSEGILASINEKLGALIDTLANPEAQQLEDNFKESLTGVNDNFFGDSAKGQAVTVSDVGNLADTQSTVKNIFQSDYTVSDFFALFGDSSYFGWFSVETAMDLNPISYGGVSAADMDDPYNMQAYYENLEKVRGKR